MNEFTYQKFLENKLKDEHTNAHLLEEDILSYKEKNIKLLKDIAVLRKSENDTKLRLKQLEEKLVEQQLEIKRLKEVRIQRTKQVTEKRLREEKLAENTMQSKQIFKMYLDNTFPKHKGLLKKILKVLYIMEDHENKEPEQKVKFYRLLFEKGVKRFLDWLFPKQQLGENKKEIAETIVNRWKQKQQEEKGSIQNNNLVLLKQASYLKQIEALEAQLLELHSSKKLLEGRLKTYERTTQVKGSEFVAHLKKMLRDTPQYQPEAYQKVEEIMKLFTEVIHLSGQNKADIDSQQRQLPQQIPLVLTNNTLQSSYKKKAAPVLKKNVFGYYQEPQFAGNYNLSVPTKHTDCKKSTQTLSQDLCILTLHPVILVTLIDGNIKPQRTRHSLQHYVKIRVNEENAIDSTVKEGLQIVWNQPFLLKDYDFPFINVQLMHKSKGLRDYSVGGGKFSASCEEEKIVNVRKQKQFIGRVRFSLTYPKGNIYQFKITSVILQIRAGKNVLKETVSIQFPFNPIFSLQFLIPQKVHYTDKSMIILQSCQDKMEVRLPNEHLQEKISLREFTAKQGNKEVTVILDNQWKVIIEGEVYLLICEDEEPQRISDDLLEGGKGDFFSVRAPPPVVTVTYDNTTLHSHIKFPLVFQLQLPINSLSIIKQQSNRMLKEEKVQAITNAEGLLKVSEFIKAPGKIYKFFIETIEGEQVLLRHESHLFERLLKEIFLQITYKQDEVQEINYSRKGKQQREKLYKQFTIQTKELMLNHYKVFTRHFKRIGFVKFKLGYTIYDNQLKTQSSKQQSEAIQYSLPEGTYFLHIELSHAHLNTKASGSSYSCKLNQNRTNEVKGNQPVWQEGFTFSFELKEKFEFSMNYEITEHGTFGDNVIYAGTAMINARILQLGMLMLSLDKDGQDCLHFCSIRVPESVFQLTIESIQAQIEEQADWIGKIDPYLTIYSQNRKLLKTDYLDNVGSHPVWSNINQNFFITSKSAIKQVQEEIISLIICDYDLIGRDDYIGEVKIGTKLNPELMAVGQIRVLHGNIVKDNQICGSLKLRGQFKRIKQQSVVIPQEKPLKLTNKDAVSRLVIYKLQFHQLHELQGDRGSISLSNASEILKKHSFVFEEAELSSLGVTIWRTKPQQHVLTIQREHKSFFKTSIETVGTITIPECSHFLLSTAAILDENKQVVGSCSFFIEYQSRVKYCIISEKTFCKNSIKLKSDLDDQVNLILDRTTVKESNYLFYKTQFYSQQNQGKGSKTVNLKEVGNRVYSIGCSAQNHQQPIGCLNLSEQLVYQGQLQERSELQKAKHDRKFKRIKYLHWQPYKYHESYSFKLTVKCRNNECFDLTQKLQGIYNDYLLLEEMGPIIFEASNAPELLIIQNLSTKQEERICLKEDVSRIFLPNRGALYYHLEDYNSKSVLEINFQYLFIRPKNVEIMEKFTQVEAHLTTTSSVKTFSSRAIHKQECFCFQKMTLIIPEPPSSGILFLEGYFDGQKEGSQTREKIAPFKFGLRLQNNKKQYRFLDGQDFIVHALFDCCLISRNYESAAPPDHTIYGMSFIELKSIEFQINEDPSSRPVYLQISLNNQIEKIYLQRKGQSNIYKARNSSIYFIESLVEASFSIVEEGILSNSVIGSGLLTLTEQKLIKQSVELCTQVRNNKSNVGRLTISYINLRQMQFIDVNLFSYISKANQLTMKAELQEIGPNKHKYQSVTLTSRGNVPRLESEDSFIVAQDPRNYQINVMEQESKRLLGEFKLYHELEAIGSKALVLQPLRTSSDSLNGVMIIQYEKKQASRVGLQKNKDLEIHLIELSISNLTFKDHSRKLTEEFSIELKTSARKLLTRPIEIPRPTHQKPFVFTLYSNQNCQLRLLEKSEEIGSGFIKGPFLEGEERVLLLKHEEKVCGVCCMKVRFIPNQQLALKREVVSIQASDLIDTEYFVKMKPFMEIETLNKQNWPCFRSDIGLGKENFFWKLGIISDQPLNFIFKDKDMFFDDLIGNAVLPKNQSMQLQQVTHTMTLTSAQGDNRKGGNGTIRITTQPIFSQQPTNNAIKKVQEARVNKYLLRLGGISSKTSQFLTQGQELQISIGTNLKKYTLFCGKYCNDAQYYLSSKNVELQFDTVFLNQLQSCYVIVSLLGNRQLIAQQLIELWGSEKINNTQIFTITQVKPIETRISSLNKVFFWFCTKLEQNVEVYALTRHHIQRLQVLRQEKRLLLVQPMQLIDIAKEPITLVLIQDKEELSRAEISLSPQNPQNAGGILKNVLFDNKSKQIGFYYAEFNSVYSEGQSQYCKNLIGKSSRKWLFLTIFQATLTKDLEFLSKMDPYCKFCIEDGDQSQKQWMQTSVQENIGLEPIWNESFFVPISSKKQAQSRLRLVIMDSEVTVDRKIGQAKILVSELQTQERRQIELDFNEQQKVGKVIISLKVAVRFIIIRSIFSAYEGAEQSLLLLHEDNSYSRKGKKIQEGVVYPLNEELPLIFQSQASRKTFRFDQLKEMASKRLIFEKELIQIEFDLFD